MNFKTYTEVEKRVNQLSCTMRTLEAKQSVSHMTLLCSFLSPSLRVEADQIPSYLGILCCSHTFTDVGLHS